MRFSDFFEKAIYILCFSNKTLDYILCKNFHNDNVYPLIIPHTLCFFKTTRLLMLEINLDLNKCPHKETSRHIKLFIFVLKDYYLIEIQT